MLGGAISEVPPGPVCVGDPAVTAEGTFGEVENMCAWVENDASSARSPRAAVRVGGLPRLHPEEKLVLSPPTYSFVSILSICKRVSFSIPF